MPRCNAEWDALHYSTFRHSSILRLASSNCLNKKNRRGGVKGIPEIVGNRTEVIETEVIDMGKREKQTYLEAIPNDYHKAGRAGRVMDCEKYRVS